jgi:hypothetical protein
MLWSCDLLGGGEAETGGAGRFTQMPTFDVGADIVTKREILFTAETRRHGDTRIIFL